MTALNWATIALAAAATGLVTATVITFRQHSKELLNLRRSQNLLQITTKDGDLVEIINLDEIDQEDPAKIKRALEELRRMNQATAS